MKIKKLIAFLLLCTIVSAGIVIILYAFSEDIAHRNNGFIRRYPQHPVTHLYDVNIGFNSYYIAGFYKNHMYLGNTTAPLWIIDFNLITQDTFHKKIKIIKPHTTITNNLKLTTKDSLFYMLDGTIPTMYRGNIKNWRTKQVKNIPAYFSLAQPGDNNQLLIRTISTDKNENEIGRIMLSDSNSLQLNPTLIQKQVDGIFGSDGMLLYNHWLHRLLYIYFYRNEFIVIKNNLELDYRGKTIDTVRLAKIKVVDIPSHSTRKLAGNPLLINRQAATAGNYLFINSNRLGKYEPKEMLKEASIIDIYNIPGKTYEFSFYLYDNQQDKLRNFQVYQEKLYALMGHYLVCYSLKAENFNELLK